MLTPSMTNGVSSLAEPSLPRRPLDLAPTGRPATRLQTRITRSPALHPTVVTTPATIIASNSRANPPIAPYQHNLASLTRQESILRNQQRPRCPGARHGFSQYPSQNTNARSIFRISIVFAPFPVRGGDQVTPPNYEDHNAKIVSSKQHCADI